MFNMFTKMGSIVSGAKKAANVAKEVAEAAEILSRDEDKNGKPDLQDKFELLGKILMEAGKAHVALAKENLELIKVEAVKIKAQLDEVREGVK